MIRRLLCCALAMCLSARRAPGQSAAVAPAPAAAAADSGFYFSKESQFLFQITTRRVSRAALAETLPLSGVIIARPDGRAAPAGRRYAESQVPEMELHRIRGAAGSAATLTVRSLPGRSFDARLLSVSGAPDPATLSARAVFEVSDPGGELMEGMPALINAQTGKNASGFIVPSAAVIEADGRPLIFVKTSAESFSPREIRLGLQSPDRIEILAGLQGDERVAVSGVLQLRAAYLAAR